MKTELRILLCLAGLLTCRTFSAQRDLNLVAARKLTEKGFYYEAKEKYEAALKNDPANADINVEYADILFFYLSDYENAYAPILKSVLPGTDTSVTHLYCLAKCEQFLEKYSEAELHYNKLLKAIARKAKYWELKNEVEISLKSISFAKKNSGNSNLARMKVVNAGKNVNTQYEEYVPVVDEKENFLLFTSRRKNQFNKQVDEEDDKYPEDMYVSVRDGNNFSPAELLPAAFNSTQDIRNSKRNESLVSLSPDGNTLFLYKEGTLWRSDFSNGKWSLPALLDKKIIADDYDNHVSITADGRTVYFTSERKRGYGGTDIYRCSKKEDGTWTEPENLGKAFNTGGNEQSPFISKDGRTLYFSSDKRDGFGGYDIYVSVFDGKEWSEPQNMGLPVNSSADDIFFYPNENGSEGYLSSNRRGAIGGFDIFRFYYLDKPSFKPPGKKNLMDKPEELNERELNTAIAVQYTGASKIFFRLNDSVIVEDTVALFSMLKRNTDFKVEMQVIYNCDTCFYRSEKFFAYTVKGIAPQLTPEEKIGDEEFRSAEIYFATNSATLEKEYRKSLDKVAEWLKANSSQRIAVYGYADSNGSWQYNKILSEKRAEAVVKYLTAKEILLSQIQTVEGKGEIEASIDSGKSRKVEIELVPVALTNK